jgi:putative transposase
MSVAMKLIVWPWLSLPGSPFSLKALNLRRSVVGCNGMFVLLASLLFALRGCLHARAALHAENLALRHQLLLLQRAHQSRRLRLRSCDRLVWVWLSRVWSNWRCALRIVKPETVIAWHRQGFRLYWNWKSRVRQGRPSVPTEVQNLIQEMSSANPHWGAPRILGELQKLGIHLAQATVAKYMVRHRKPPSQTWRTFLERRSPNACHTPSRNGPSH